RLAAAIEACASNGAQLMPPVMGAVAFVMADFLQVPYREVALAALLPSILYYTALFIQCDLETARYGIGRVDTSDIPPMRSVLASGWIFLAPFAAVVGAMFWMNWEPEPAAALASAIIIGLGLFIGYRGARMHFRDIWSAVIETGIGVCEIVVISAIGGYVLGLFQVGGLSFALTAYLVDLGAANLFLLLVICALTNIVLGLGLPTLAVYVMLAILVAPALVKVGVPAMAAHLFILYFGIMSLITPPIATAAFVAATIAKTDPMAAGWTAMRFGWASYIVPFLFVYSPALIMRGSWTEIVLVMALSVAGIWFVCAGMTGYALRVMGVPQRAGFVLAGLMLLMPFQAATINAWINVAGAALGILLFVLEFRNRREVAHVRAYRLVRRRLGSRGHALDEAAHHPRRAGAALSQGRRHGRRAGGPLLPPAGAAFDGQADRQRREMPVSRPRVRCLGQVRQDSQPGHGSGVGESARLPDGRAKPLALDLDGRRREGRPGADRGFPLHGRPGVALR